MKKFALLALIAAAALSVAPKSAFAGRNDDTAVAAIGGFIGGLVIGAALDNDHDRYDRDTTVVIGTGYGDRHYGDRHYRDRDGGYWKTVTTKHWVPGYWTHSRDRRGRPIKIYVDGHWDYRTDRVWVSYDRHGYGRGYGYGYDRGYRR